MQRQVSVLREHKLCYGNYQYLSSKLHFYRYSEITCQDVFIFATVNIEFGLGACKLYIGSVPNYHNYEHFPANLDVFSIMQI